MRKQKSRIMTTQREGGCDNYGRSLFVIHRHHFNKVNSINKEIHTRLKRLNTTLKKEPLYTELTE